MIDSFTNNFIGFPFCCLFRLWELHESRRKKEILIKMEPKTVVLSQKNRFEPPIISLFTFLSRFLRLFYFLSSRCSCFNYLLACFVSPLLFILPLFLSILPTVVKCPYSSPSPAYLVSPFVYNETARKAIDEMLAMKYQNVLLKRNAKLPRNNSHKL